MVTLILPHHMAQLVEVDSSTTVRPVTRVALQASTWSEVVCEIRTSFPRLAEGLFTDSGEVTDGFVVVVNDNVVRDPTRIGHVDGSAVVFLAAMAGG